MTHSASPIPDCPGYFSAFLRVAAFDCECIFARPEGKVSIGYVLSFTGFCGTRELRQYFGLRLDNSFRRCKSRHAAIQFITRTEGK
jgi:hypothetical protein